MTLCNAHSGELLEEKNCENIGIVSLERVCAISYESEIGERFVEVVAQECLGTPLALHLDPTTPVQFESTPFATFSISPRWSCAHPQWPTPATPYLVRTADPSIPVESGAGLLGNGTLLPNGTYARDGFDALRALDTNRDGQVDTNLVFFALPNDADISVSELCKRLDREYGVKIGGGYSRPGDKNMNYIRAATNMGVDDDGIERTLEGIECILAGR